MRSRQDAAERHRSLAFGEARVAADAIGYQPSPHPNYAASRRWNTGRHFAAPLRGTLLYMAFWTYGIGGYARLATGYFPAPRCGVPSPVFCRRSYRSPMPYN